MFNQITIIAPGLLGASLGFAIQQQGLSKRIHVHARRPETRLSCLQLDWCDAVFSSPEDAVKGSDLVIICTPVGHIAPLVETIADHLNSNTLVTDVGSTKSLVCRQSHAALKNKALFIGSHPMAGSERTGLENADPRLFTQRSCFVTPLTDTPQESVEKIVRFWKALEMQVATVSPEKHDEIVAHLSHLPHLLATTLAVTLGEADPSWTAFSGKGLRDTSRIASGSPVMWRDICEQNREEILRSLAAFEDKLHEIQATLKNRDYFRLQHLLERGKRYRDTLD